MRPMRVLIADDHPVVRGMISDFLRARCNVEAVHEAVDGMDAIEQARRYQPDIAFVDARMPLKNGFDATRELKADHPAMRVYVMSTEDSFGPLALANLADAFIQKRSLKQSLSDLLNPQLTAAAA